VFKFNRLDEIESESSNSVPLPSPSLFPPHRKIEIEHNFELFHLVLQYFYTKTFCFITTPETFTISNVPTTIDAEGIYEIACRYKIEPLEEKALHFLEATCNIDNITSRAFSRFAEKHPNAGKLYDKYFMEHWDKVKCSTKFEKYFTEKNSCGRVNTKFRNMMTGRT
jgi:hypothetical protein